MTDARPVFLFWIALLACPFASEAAQTPEETFAAGVTAFRAGKVAEARDDFLAARAGGLDSPQLQYDLALAYYKLGQDTEAKAEFERLRTSGEYADIADFHLALLAVRA